MIKIKYNNQKSFEEVSFSRNNNVVTVTPSTPNTNGFYNLEDGRRDIVG